MDSKNAGAHPINMDAGVLSVRDVDALRRMSLLYNLALWSPGEMHESSDGIAGCDLAMEIKVSIEGRSGFALWAAPDNKESTEPHEDDFGLIMDLLESIEGAHLLVEGSEDAEIIVEQAEFEGLILTVKPYDFGGWSRTVSVN